MKLLRYGAPGAEKPAILDADGAIRDLSGHVSDIGGKDIDPAALAALAKLDPASLPLVAGTPRIGPCVAGTGKFICIGLNYADHAAESGMAVPPEPVVFMKATSAIVGPNDDLLIPRGSEKTDWEVELAVIIGKKASYVDEADALSYVAGYAIHNDYSERAYQLERGGQWVKGKSNDTFAPLGPYLVTREDIPNANDLDLWLSLNGRKIQDSNTSDMIFQVGFLVSYLSQFMTLLPGDVISTGTPAGVGLGMKPQVYLKPGDMVELGIEGLGVQKQEAVAWKAI